MSCLDQDIKVDQIGVLIEQPDVTDYDVGYQMAYGGTIAGLRVKSSLGTGQCSVKINGVACTGLDHVDIGAANSEYNASGNNIFNPGDDIAFTIESGDLSLINVRATIVLTR